MALKRESRPASEVRTDRLNSMQSRMMLRETPASSTSLERS
jgi:hypothetical protein